MALTLAFYCLISSTLVTGYGARNYLLGMGLTLCCTFFGHSVFSWSLKYLPAPFISTAKLGEPVFATILGIFLFQQMPARWQVIGGIIILIGLFGYTKQDS